MDKKKKKISIIVFVVIIAVLLVGIFLTKPSGGDENIQTAMRDAVLHEENRIFSLLILIIGLLTLKTAGKHLENRHFTDFAQLHLLKIMEKQQIVLITDIDLQMRLCSLLEIWIPMNGIST